MVVLESVISFFCFDVLYLCVLICFRLVVCFLCFLGFYCVLLCIFFDLFVVFFFFKQKTAYEMRISDWSSDVCSSDLAAIADRVIRAPFSGWVSLRNVSAGAVIPAGTEIATISDLSQIKLDFSIPETLLATVQEGQVIEAQAAAFPDHPVRGKVQTIDPVVNPATRAVTIRAILPNPDLRLKPGMLLTVQVEAGAHTALSVPELAVLGDGEDRFVYIVDDQGKAQRTEVRTGARQDGRIEIVDGLSRGQKVVTDGIVKLSDGLPVRVTKNAGAAGSKENMMAEPGG